MVPFERYTFHAFAFAIDPTTNSSVHIAMFSVLDTLADFVIRSHDATDVSKFTYDSGDGLVTTEVESRVLRAEIERSAIAKAFAVCLFLINWALTIGSVYATALVASGRLEVTSMVTGLPFSALLAIPTVRSLCSGLPPLGVYIGKFYIITSAIPFRGLIHSSRCSSVFRADRDHRVVFAGCVENPHEMSTGLTI